MAARARLRRPYESHSSDIASVLNDFLEMAQTELDAVRHAESDATRNFALAQAVPSGSTRAEQVSGEDHDGENKFTTLLAA